MAKLTICRVAFCEKCHKENRPNENSVTVLYGSSSGSFLIHKAEYYVRHKDRGFTPHIFVNMGFISKGSAIMEVQSFCAIHGCGVEILQKKENGNYEWVVRDKRIQMMTFEEWFALKNFVNTGYEI